MTKILYLEDENYLGRIVKESLVSRGFDVKLVADGALLLDAFRSFEPDICVLDVMVPHVDGFSIGKEIRKINSEIPIIYLTAKSQTEDILKGFSIGGNDYIKKPFSMEELIARVNNLITLTSLKNENKTSSVALGEYIFKPSEFLLEHSSHSYKLSHRENELIILFSQNINSQIERKHILKSIWGDDSLYNSRNLDVYIRKLRKYFENDKNIKLITLRGVGYYFGIS